MNAALRDRWFLAALAAGPFFWAAMLAASGPPSDAAWPLRDPARLASLALAYPVLEEIVFRGVLQPALLNTRWGAQAFAGISGANLATSVLFAIAHLPAHTQAWALAMIAPSLLFGIFRERHSTLLSPCVLHVFYNTGYYWAFPPA